ncbi:MAG: GNAT family N-acetyltransferase [Pseudomonadota bacterium]
MEYRLAELADLTLLAQMRWAYWQEDGDAPALMAESAFVDEFVEWLASRLSKNWFVWCALEHDVIVAHVYIQVVTKLPKPSVVDDAFGYVTNVYTVPSRRGESVGAALMDRVTGWAQATDLEFLMLWPSDASTPFWHRQQFASGGAMQKTIRPYIN